MNAKAILTHEEQESFLYKMIHHQRLSASEKEIETEVYSLMLHYYQEYLKEIGEIGVVSYSNPYNIDGLLTISTLQEDRAVLIEAKTHQSLSTTGIWAPLSQALQYTHLLSNLGKTLPGVILIATEREWYIVQIDELAELLSRSDLPWESTPSTRSPEIEGALQELNLHLIHHLLIPQMNLATAMEDLTSTLYASNYLSTKTPRGIQAAPTIEIELPEDEYTYSMDHQRWYLYNSNVGVWEKALQQQLILDLTQKATQQGVPRIARRSVVSSSLDALKESRLIEEWPLGTGEINLPSGSWRNGVVKEHAPSQYHRWIMGVDPTLTNRPLEDNNLNLTLGFAVNSIIESPNELHILLVSLTATEKAALLQIMGSYADSVGVATLSSSGSRSSMNDAKVLVANASGLDLTGFNKVINRVMESERFSSSTVILLAEEQQLSDVGNSLVSSHGINMARYREPQETGMSPGELLYVALHNQEAIKNALERDRHAWRYSGDNIRLWMEECLVPDKGSATLNEDLRDSYNNWLEDHGYSPISHKVFLNRLVDHPLFTEWDLTLVKGGRTGKLKLSQWSDPKKKERIGYTPRHIEGSTSSHVKFLRFAA